MYFFCPPLSLSLSLSALTKPHIIIISRETPPREQERRERVIKRERSRVIIKRGRRSKVTRAACIRQKERGVREEALCVFESCVNWHFQKKEEKSNGIIILYII